MTRKPYVWIYRPDNIKSMRKLAKVLKAEFGFLRGIPIYDDINIEPVSPRKSKAKRQKREGKDAES